ncbi:MAG: hypothetical protein GTN67_01145 [Hydrotalea flava]|uniref:DUF5777 family beta-barrel protein n=1 Tax=Hydrotalea lipotrueae TaxID=2803817 RepID=UPI0016A28178|nr:DUF5777 family beta-barrel protein [Hydrotalea lipotrueae]NIM34105.1 hypothetical protein [Hydrotalea flava]GHU57822.1 hypothetical protein FACS189444_0530 [Spirochaetia bacterium]NIM36929.1 hypothetical protein [Hydrotalea flava]NIN02121.1 hypothetical protein [Hydrotalea flava]NIN13774.1 hypothetical protein [Hydrotalea flava]
MRTRKIFLFIFLVGICKNIQAQDSSFLSMLNDSVAAHAKTTYVTGTFKGNHIVNMQTVESPAKGAMYFLIMHRFGALNSGAYNLFGLDNATLRLGFDYGITDLLSVGVGRTSLDKAFDGYVKYKFVRQTDGSNKIPVTADILLGVSNYTQRYPDKPYLDASYRTVYTAQFLVARKFKKYSLQIVPTFLHYNLVPTAQDANNIFAIGIGGRVKLTNRMSITSEYNYLPPNQVVSMTVYNSLSFAWEIETGGHVFQLVFSNSQGMTEPYYITRTAGSWANGDIYFGFNISRNFNITKHAKLK